MLVLGYILLMQQIYATSTLCTMLHLYFVDMGLCYTAKYPSALDMCMSASTDAAGFAASQPFLRGLLDRWHIKPLAYAREEYKSVVKQFTDKAYSKANREATQGWLNGWMGQIVRDVAAARGLKPQDVCKALNASPLSADEAAAAGLITAPGHRSTATQTLLHSTTSAADPATLVSKQVAELSNIEPAESKLKAAELSELKAGQEAVSAAKSGESPQMPALDSAAAAQPSSISIHTKGTAQLVLHSAAEQQDCVQVPAVSLTESSGVDTCSKLLELADPKEQSKGASSASKQQTLQCNLKQGTAQHVDTNKVQRIQATRKPLNRAMVVQVSPDKLQMKCCLTVPIGKYIQVYTDRCALHQALANACFSEREACTV